MNDFKLPPPPKIKQKFDKMIKTPKEGDIIKVYTFDSYYYSKALKLVVVDDIIDGVIIKRQKVIVKKDIKTELHIKKKLAEGYSDLHVVNFFLPSNRVILV
jgi:hypothetical protein